VYYFCGEEVDDIDEAVARFRYSYGVIYKMFIKVRILSKITGNRTRTKN